MHFLILKEMYPRLTLFRMCVSSVPARGIQLVLQSTKSVWPYGYKQTPRRVCAPMFMCGAASDLGKEEKILLSSQTIMLKFSQIVLFVAVMYQRTMKLPWAYLLHLGNESGIFYSIGYSSNKSKDIGLRIAIIGNKKAFQWK